VQNTLSAKESFRNLLLEWNSFQLPFFTSRNLIKNHKNKNLIALSGIRGAGKTFACFEMIANLLKSGISCENIIYINFEDERLEPIAENIIPQLLAAHTEQFVRDTSKPRYFFLDEIGMVPGWQEQVEIALGRNPDLTIIAAGSSLKISTPALLEKTQVVPIYPFSFQEFLNAKGFEMEFSWNILFSEQRSIIKRYFNEYSEKGGFPEVINSGSYKHELQKNYRTLFDRDIVEPNTIQSIRQLDCFLKIQMGHFGETSSISMIEKAMRSIGYQLSKNTLMSYLRFALDAGLFHEVKKLNAEPPDRHPRILYAADHGLINAVRFIQPECSERILKNMVFMELRRKHSTINYSSGNPECDFVVTENGVVTQCLQVCDSVENNDRAGKKIKDLGALLRRFDLASGTVLTDDEHSDIDLDGRTVYVRPFWFFALEQPEATV
jgi:uncharacterized protein